MRCSALILKFMTSLGHVSFIKKGSTAPTSNGIIKRNVTDLLFSFYHKSCFWFKNYVDAANKRIITLLLWIVLMSYTLKVLGWMSYTLTVLGDERGIRVGA